MSELCSDERRRVPHRDTVPHTLSIGVVLEAIVDREGTRGNAEIGRGKQTQGVGVT